MNKDLKEVLAVFALLGCFAAGYFVRQFEDRKLTENGKRFEVISEIRDVLTEKGYDFSADDSEAVESAADTYFKKMTDEYFKYTPTKSDVDMCLDKINYSAMAVDNGFKVSTTDDGRLMISEVAEDSYAESQGLFEGDIIDSIDGVEITQENFTETAVNILGKIDSSVNLTIIRGAGAFELTYIRSFKKFDPSEHYWDVEKNIRYVDLSGSFDMNISKITDEAFSEDVENYIVDLRNNGGGLTDMAMKVLAPFIGKRDVVKVHCYDGTEKIYSTVSDKVFENKKIVILINEKTASAAEITAAALKLYYPNTTLVGTTTFGKGVAQVEESISEGDIKYTMGKFTVGDLPCWQGYGITPDVIVDMDDELDDDVQLQAAIDLLKE